MTEIIVTAIVTIMVSPVMWRGFNQLLDKISKRKTLSNNEFKDYLFKKVEEQSKHIAEQSKHIESLNTVIVELRLEVEKLRSEIRILEQSSK